jgi:hypothetical protein
MQALLRYQAIKTQLSSLPRIVHARVKGQQLHGCNNGLRETGIKQPDPIKNFYEDLEKFLLQWKKQDYEIILMMDANETIGDKPGGLAPIMGWIGLIDLIHFQHQIDDSANTYIRGTKCIDGSSKVQKYCSKSGMLPFGVGYQSNHKALFIKVYFWERYYKHPMNRLIQSCMSADTSDTQGMHKIS